MIMTLRAEIAQLREQNRETHRDLYQKVQRNLVALAVLMTLLFGADKALGWFL
jgi:hypothetical protein